MSKAIAQPNKIPKTRTAFYIEDDLLKKCDLCLLLDGSSSRNEFVNNAIRVYVGSLEAADSQQYLAQYITDAITGTVGLTENRIARLLFKLSVELSITMNVVAAGAGVDEVTLRKLRAKCVDDVKKSTGAVSFEEAARFQRRGNS